jgi:DNA polymerase-3 subunit epsilon
MSQYILVFDTETSGFPKKGIPADDPGQNVVVELAASLVDLRTRRVQSQISFMLKTDVEIPQFLVENVHGISNQMTHEIGVGLDTAVAAFTELCEAADWNVAAHNAKFDKEMMDIMFKRSAYAFMSHKWNAADFYCTMERSTNIVQMPPTPAMMKAGRNTFKAPKLEEAFAFFFKKPMGEAHRAYVDVEATIAVYFAIQDYLAQQGEEC